MHEEGGEGTAETASEDQHWARGILPAPTLKSRQWAHALARECREPVRVDGFIEPAGRLHHLVMPVSDGFRFEARELGTRRWHRYDVGPGEVCVVGAGSAPAELCWQSLGRGRTLDVLEVYVQPTALLRDKPREDVSALAPHWHVLRDPLLSELMREIKHGLGCHESTEQVFGDLATTLLSVQLDRAHGVHRRAPNLQRGGLPPLVVQRVRDYIAARLGRRIRLQDLAALAGLSTFHFSRAFKASTGLSPSRYVLHCRIAEAKRLLASSTLPITQIALLTGFSDTSQLSTRFRACTGTTPTAFRRLSRR